MAKLRITFEVDNIALFDAIKAMKGETDAIGARVIGTMLTGKASFADEIGMAAYGITISSVEQAPAEDPGPNHG